MRDAAIREAACELASQRAHPDRLLVARCGLLAGPGDPSDRAGTWVARAARAPDEPPLLPAQRKNPAQVLDVRDRADWLVRSAERRLFA